MAPPSVAAPAATLTTIDGAPLWSKQAATQRPVASTIKMLNALVVRDRTRLTDVVVVSRKAAAINEGDVGLEAGQRLTVNQLLDMMLVASANDAAEALAIHIAGTEARYVAMMNAKARQLGLRDTRAADPHGLSKRERSSASDLAALARHVLADPVLKAKVAQRSVQVPRLGAGPLRIPSTNHLLGEYAGILGVKTGYTRPAGYCLVASARRGGVQIVGVVLGAPTLTSRFTQMRKLLDWGFAHTHTRSLVSTQATFTVPAACETASVTIPARVIRPVSKPLLDGGGTVVRTVRASSPATLPVAAGQRVGLLDLRYRGVLLASIPLVAAADVSAPATGLANAPSQ